MDSGNRNTNGVDFMRSNSFTKKKEDNNKNNNTVNFNNYYEVRLNV